MKSSAASHDPHSEFRTPKPDRLRGLALVTQLVPDPAEPNGVSPRLGDPRQTTDPPTVTTTTQTEPG